MIKRETMRQKGMSNVGSVEGGGSRSITISEWILIADVKFHFLYITGGIYDIHYEHIDSSNQF